MENVSVGRKHRLFLQNKTADQMNRDRIPLIATKYFLKRVLNREFSLSPQHGNQQGKQLYKETAWKHHHRKEFSVVEKDFSEKSILDNQHQTIGSKERTQPDTPSLQKGKNQTKLL